MRCREAVKIILYLEVEEMIKYTIYEDRILFREDSDCWDVQSCTLKNHATTELMEFGDAEEAVSFIRSLGEAAQVWVVTCSEFPDGRCSELGEMIEIQPA